jgi:ribosomal protein S18 acetylase RimI-like enzyme
MYHKSLQKIIKRLEKNKFKNVNILNFIENNKIISAEMFGESVLVRGVSDREWVYISSSNDNELKTIKSKLTEQDKNFGAIEEWVLPILTDGKELVWELPTIQYYLSDNVELPKSEYDTFALKPENAKIVFDNSEYQDFIDVDYIKDRIISDVSVGIYENGKLVAWGLTQDDGALGFLHVMDDYRRKGYGYHVTLSLIEKVRKVGKLPFACIVEDNLKSINLVKKLGFKKDKKVHWFELK